LVFADGSHNTYAEAMVQSTVDGAMVEMWQTYGVKIPLVGRHTLPLSVLADPWGTDPAAVIFWQIGGSRALAAFVGGAFLVLCDTAARLVLFPAELPVGVITAFLGAPFFLWLLVRRVVPGTHG